MKVVITKNEKGVGNGWDLIAENLDDELVLGTIRNWVFFGLEELGTYPKYDGRENSKEHENCVAKLKWRIPKYDK